MRILLISDTHVGITTEGQIRAMLKRATAEKFDLIVHAGDYGGTFSGAPCVKRTLRLIRKQFPDVPMVSTIGNHDYWCGKRRSLFDYMRNMEKIGDAFTEFGVHYIDRDGIYVQDDVKIVGSSGWYVNPRPPTNDQYYLPIGLEGDTNRYLLKRAEEALFRQTENLKLDIHETLVFLSHFPVINTGNDYKGRFEEFSWSESIGQHLQDEFGCKYFLCGHAHQLHQGPLRYECGPNYYNPAYIIVEVI